MLKDSTAEHAVIGMSFAARSAAARAMGTAAELAFRQATPADWPQISTLLLAARLPLDGAQEQLAHFVLALRGDEIAGCAGLERYGAIGLLRSVAVRESERGAGLGQELTRRVLAAARESGVRQVILLTETAGEFFPRFGFRQISRADVPPEARASVEFQTACPESATVMSVRL